MLVALVVGALVAMSQLNYVGLKRSYAWQWLPWAAVSGLLRSKVYAYVTLIVVAHRLPLSFWNVARAQPGARSTAETSWAARGRFARPR